MFFRALFLGLAVFAIGSSAMAQTSPGAYYAEQKIKLDLLEKQGRITPAQRQAMELKLLQQLSGGGSSKGPKTGVYPMPVQGGNLQGSANAAAAQQAAAKAQADKSRDALKRKAEGKKSSKKKGDKDDDDKDDKKKDDPKKANKK